MKRYFETVKTLLEIANDRFIVVVQMFISCGLYNLSDLLPPIATAGIISVITNNNFNGIWIYVFLYLIFYVINFTLHSWSMHCYTSLADYYHNEVQKKLFEHVANNELIFKKISKGKITDTCSDDIRYLVDVFDTASLALANFIKLISIFVIFSLNNIIVAIIAIIIDFIYLYLMNNNSKKVSKYYEGTRKYEDKIIDVLNQMLINLKQVKSLDMMPKIDKTINKSRSRWTYEYKLKRKNLINRKCKLPYLVYVGKILLYIFLGYQVANGKMTIDILVLLISYFELAITCTDTMLTHLLDLSNYGIRVKRIKNILDYTSNDNIDFGEIENDYINGLITFNKVSYSKDNNLILNNISFKVYPNEITTIVGHSGSGKTTIMNLLYRLDKVKNGNISIDNESIYNYSKKVYSSNVSGVFQKPFVFEMSIKDNLSLIDNNVNNQIKACKRVKIHDYIMSLPKGYNTIISEEDNLFSDGQKQLLSIARVILTKSEILLFDEVTSNIDPNSTEIIADILQDLKFDHTILMITHKPEMMKIADRVVVLDKGKVVAKGKNEEVLKSCKLYKDLRNRTFASISKDND